MKNDLDVRKQLKIPASNLRKDYGKKKNFEEINDSEIETPLYSKHKSNETDSFYNMKS